MGTHHGVVLVVRRLIEAIFVLVAVSILVLVLTNAVGDPVLLILGDNATTDQIEGMRHALGLDQPLVMQVARRLAGAAVGDFGVSLKRGTPAFWVAAERFPATLELAAGAMAIALLLGVPASLVIALRPRRPIGFAVQLAVGIGQAAPVFVVGLVLILFVGVKLRLLPVAGRESWAHLVLPALTLGIYSTAAIARVMGSAMRNALQTDYVRTARAKGLGEWLVIGKHAVRNALVPVLTIIGLQFGVMLGGAVVTESIFGWPGIGHLALLSILQRDLPVLHAAVFIITAAFVFVNCVVDLLYLWCDPRLRSA